MFLFPEIIFHTGTVNILFVQEKNQWAVRSSELQSVVDFSIWVRFLCHVKGRYVFVNQCYIIGVFPKLVFSLWTQFLPQKKISWKCILVIQILKISPVYQHFARNNRDDFDMVLSLWKVSHVGACRSNTLNFKII